MNRTNSSFNYLDWPVQNVVAFTTTIHHPNKSEHSASFGHFNLGLHVGDDEKVVESNRATLLDYLPVNSSIQWLEQVHGNNVEIIIETPKVCIADAAITQKHYTALAVMTADCLPIIISTINGSEVAVIHGGWKPLSKNIIEHTLLKMTASPNELYVWLGPCIGSEQFEVGEEVYQTFLSLHDEFKIAFIPFKPYVNEKKYLANLQLIAKIQLQRFGVKNIYSLPHCTFSMKHDYYSYRRDNITGRMATIICRS